MSESKKKNYPLVSVIINCFNGQKYLEQAVISVLNQSYKKWEIIFFNNNSSDKSHSIIEKFKDKRIKVFKSKQTYTLYKARNLALKNCKGDFISFLDVDDWWLEDKIKDQINFFLKNKEEDIVFSNLYIFREKNLKKKVFIKDSFANGISTQQIINKFQMPILTTMIRRRIFNRIKFNDFYSIIGDFDFSIRLSQIQKIHYLSKPLAVYRYHKSNFTGKNIDLHILELEHWLKSACKKTNFKNINFIAIKKIIELLRIKKNILKNKRILALKLIFKKPWYVLKFKYLLFLFIKSFLKV